MKSRQGIEVTQSQRLGLNLQLQASIHILRSDAEGLNRYLEEQAAENPALILERPDPGPQDWLPRWDSVLPGRISLDETVADTPASLISHVMQQMQMLVPEGPQRRIALTLIEALEPTGWLGRSLCAISAELGLPKAEVSAVLERLQRAEPTGLFAQSLAECLHLQAEEAGVADDIMLAMLLRLDLVADGDFGRLAKECGCDEFEVRARIRVIRGFNPKPGTQFSEFCAPVREPDLMARRGEAGWTVSLNRSSLPSLRVDETAARGAGRSAARDIVRLVERRNMTLLVVAREILRRQQVALDHGLAGLSAMTMAEVAEGLGLHASTVSRVIAGASIDTPRGTLWLRQLFSKRMGGADSPDLSAAALRARLADLIATEDRARPLSDAALAAELSNCGAMIARRTVAKYREMIGIPAAGQRKVVAMPLCDRKGRSQG